MDTFPDEKPYLNKIFPVNAACRIQLMGAGQKDVTLLEVMADSVVGKKYHFKFADLVEPVWMTQDQFAFVEELHSDLKAVLKAIQMIFPNLK